MLIPLVLLACARQAPPESAAPVLEDPTVTAGVGSPLLAGLLAEHWVATMERYPEWASDLGDTRFAGALFDRSAGAAKAWEARQRSWRERAVAITGLEAADGLTRDLLVSSLDADLATATCRSASWSVSARDNVLVDANRLAEAPRLESRADGEALLARYRQLPMSIDLATANLRRGLAEARVGVAESIQKVIEMLEAQLALPVEDSPLLAPLGEGGPAWATEAWKASLTQAVLDGVRPALQRHLAVLRDELRPAARAGDRVGVHALPEGGACYAALARLHTTLDTPPGSLHDLGLAELESIHAEFRTIGARVFATEELPEIFERLRTDPELRFETAEQVQGTAGQALARAVEAVPEWFGRLPATPCVVEPIPDYLAPYTTIAYYQPARPDGSRPGTYFVNVYEPTTRPRHEAEVLAFHESVPGHHFQIALSQELGELPAFRRHGHVTAFVEGWALYTERLADEMGLYTSDVDRLGMLSFDAWRAARLVVDTGIHAKGWTRAQAELFMAENTPLATNNIANEVDRYVTTPGQALAYKVGQLEIRALRREAESALGEQFDIAAFHDQILGAGALPLPILAERMRAWIVTARGENLDTATETAAPAP